LSFARRISIPALGVSSLSDEMKEKPNRNFQWLLTATVISFAALIVLLGLHEYHYSFDPYSWVNPGVESVESRNLWNHRKDLYRLLMLISFCSMLISGSGTAIIWFRRRSDLRKAKEA
jgi:hypothetical protein